MGFWLWRWKSGKGGLFMNGETSGMDGIVDEPLLKQGLEKGQRRFGALVLVGAIRVKAIPAAARGRIIQGQVEIVSTEEPLEHAARLVDPHLLASQFVGLD